VKGGGKGDNIIQGLGNFFFELVNECCVGFLFNNDIQ